MWGKGKGDLGGTKGKGSTGTKEKEKGNTETKERGKARERASTDETIGGAVGPAHPDGGRPDKRHGTGGQTMDP